MSVVGEHLQQVRQELTQFRKVTPLPYWRLGFVEFLLERAGECVAVGRLPEAEGLLGRAQAWLEKHRPLPQEHAAVKSRVELSGDASLVESNLRRLRLDLQRKKHLVTAPEREAFSSGLRKVESLLSQDQVGKAKSELDTVRTSLIRRLQRSYRARATAAPLVRSSDGVIRLASRSQRSSLQPVGPYNNQRALEDVCALVGERDPIWVEDFVELFNSLQGYVERLGATDKNMRKPVRA